LIFVFHLISVSLYDLDWMSSKQYNKPKEDFNGGYSVISFCLCCGPLKIYIPLSPGVKIILKMDEQSESKHILRRGPTKHRPPATGLVAKVGYPRPTSSLHAFNAEVQTTSAITVDQ
jgi:hypothetical protein